MVVEVVMEAVVEVRMEVMVDVRVGMREEVCGDTSLVSA